VKTLSRSLGEAVAMEGERFECCTGIEASLMHSFKKHVAMKYKGLYISMMSYV
jgi:hypothetical protein